jgi:hypothetical protein
MWVDIEPMGDPLGATAVASLPVTAAADDWLAVDE